MCLDNPLGSHVFECLPMAPWLFIGYHWTEPGCVCVTPAPWVLALVVKISLNILTVIVFSTFPHRRNAPFPYSSQWTFVGLFCPKMTTSFPYWEPHDWTQHSCPATGVLLLPLHTYFHYPYFVVYVVSAVLKLFSVIFQQTVLWDGKQVWKSSSACDVFASTWYTRGKQKKGQDNLYRDKGMLWLQDKQEISIHERLRKYKCQRKLQNIYMN